MKKTHSSFNAPSHLQKYFLIIFITFLLPLSMNSQNCGADELHEFQLQQDELYQEKIKEVEHFIYQKKKENNNELTESDPPLYTIPVVFHVIHKGETEGVGSNISDESIYVGLDMTNANFANSNGLGTDTGIQFCLATTDPDGNPTNGINRVSGTGVENYVQYGVTFPPLFSSNNINTLKDLSRWPESEYYNIYIVHEISSNSNIGGFANYPTGLMYDATVMKDDFVIQGGLLTHELGHGLNLRHTFSGQNNNCGGSSSCCPANDDCELEGDLVCDTPPHTQNECSNVVCSNGDMFENSSKNHMSYCGNPTRFTPGQIERMHAAILSPARVSLLSSVGCTPVENRVNILALQGEVCGDQIYPLARIHNGGSIPLTSLTYEYQADGISAEPRMVELNIPSGSNEYIYLDPIEFNSSFLNLAVTISLPNGVEDDVSDDNTQSMNYYGTSTLGLDVIEDFENVTTNIPFGWRARTTLEGVELTSQWRISNQLGSRRVWSASTPFPNGRQTNTLWMPDVDLTSPEDDRIIFSYDYYFNKFLPSENITGTYVSVELNDCSGGSQTIWKRTEEELNPNEEVGYVTVEIDISEYRDKIVEISFIHSYTLARTNVRFDNIKIESKEPEVLADCPADIDGFTLLGEFENHKYYLSDEPTIWSNARTIANGIDGYLVTINSEAENDFIQQNISELVFIGLNDEDVEGVLTWENGASIDYSNYDICDFCNENSPLNDAVVIHSWNGGWSFASNSSSRKYIVEIPCVTTGLQVDCDLNIDPADLNVFGTDDYSGNIVEWTPPTATTDCPGGVIIEQISGMPSGSFFAAWTTLDHIVVYQITDACGNEEICVNEFGVSGVYGGLNCLDDIIVTATSAAGATVFYDEPTVTPTTCIPGVPELVSGLPSGSVFPIGTTNVTFVSFFGGSNTYCQNAIQCQFSVTVLEENSSGECPDDIAGFTTIGAFGNSKYYLSDEVARPTDAQAIAESNSGYLAVITSQAENDFIQQGADGLSYIGLNDFISDGNLEWVNGEDLIYNNINPCDVCNENSEDQDFAVIQSWNGAWSFSNFWNQRKYIMEIPCGQSNELPDITLSNVKDLEEAGETGEIVSFSFDLNNMGTAVAVEDYNINFYLSEDANVNTPDDDVLVGQVITGATPIGTIADVPASITVPNLPEGDYFLLLIADVDNDIAESYENNNTIVTSFAIVSDGGGGECPTTLLGYTFLGEFGNSAYFLSQEVTRPDQAQNNAVDLGGYLAVINSQGENDFIAQELNELAYIGLNDAQTENTLAWVNGDAVNFTNFDICGICNENDQDFDYAVMHSWNGGWSWSNFYNQRKYIVEFPCEALLENMNFGITLLENTQNENPITKLEKLMPNPATNDIYAAIQSGIDQEVEIQIFDARGLLLKSEVKYLQKGNNKVNISINDLPVGFYNLYIPQADRENAAMRFVKIND